MNNKRISITALALCAIFTSTVSAQTIFWTGVNGANWSGDGLGGQNWSSTTATPGVAATPVNGNSLRWLQNRPNLTSNNDISGLSVNGISFQGGVSGVVMNGNKLTLNGNITQAAVGATINLPLELSNNVTFEGGTGSDVLTLNGPITETGGSRGINLTKERVALYGENSYSGNMIIGVSADTTLYINTLKNNTEAQSLGQGSVIQFGHQISVGEIIYTGAATTTDKQFQIGRMGNYTGSGRFTNDGSGAVVWTGAQSGNSNGTLARTFTLGGTNTDDNDWQSVIRNSGANDIISFTKEDAGKWILSGTNTYTGATTVSEGTLLINGSTAAGSAVSVASGAVIGGSGAVNGDLTLADGALFAFDPNSTLTLDGTLSLDAGFGVNSLRNTSGGAFDWSAIANDTYTLMNTGFAFSNSNISNFGAANAESIGDGRSAYFENGSLQLVVIPEPGSLALVGLAGVALLVGLRRRK